MISDFMDFVFRSNLLLVIGLIGPILTLNGVVTKNENKIVEPKHLAL